MTGPRPRPSWRPCLAGSHRNSLSSHPSSCSARTSRWPRRWPNASSDSASATGLFSTSSRAGRPRCRTSRKSSACFGPNLSVGWISMTIAPDTAVVLDNRFASELPELAVRWQAEATPNPRLLVLNEPLATELGLNPDWLRRPDWLGLLVGTHVPEGAEPVAQGYAGHQFGGWVPRLGDGRALLLGELVG